MLMDTTREVEELQNKLWMERSVQERAKCMFGMFAFARRAMIASLPSGLSDREIKDQIYFRTYGEHLPDDFFKDDDSDV
jgi:hypothetical protein